MFKSFFHTTLEPFTKADSVQGWETMWGFFGVICLQNAKHADNIDLTSGAEVKPMLLIYVQEEATLSLIAAAICLVWILTDTSADLVKAVQQFWVTLLLWIVQLPQCL